MEKKLFDSDFSSPECWSGRELWTHDLPHGSEALYQLSQMVSGPLVSNKEEWGFGEGDWFELLICSHY